MPMQRRVKRRKTSAASLSLLTPMMSHLSTEEEEAASPPQCPDDELQKYLAVPQIKYKTKKDAVEWWSKHTVTLSSPTYRSYGSASASGQ